MAGRDIVRDTTMFLREAQRNFGPDMHDDPFGATVLDVIKEGMVIQGFSQKQIDLALEGVHTAVRAKFKTLTDSWGS